MEPETVVASWNEERKRLDLWVSSQAPYFVRYELAHLLELELDQVHTHQVAVGGSFGVKAKVGEHEVLAARLSMRAGRPVRLALDRAEEFAATKTRHPYRIDIETGMTDEGTVTDRRVHIVADNGAYNHNGPSVPGYSAILAGSLYRIAGAEIDTTLVYTNTEPGGSFRGYGNPQITFAMESQLDELADELQLDPLALRIRNANQSGDVTLTGWKLSSAKLVDCLEAVRDAIDWDAKRARGGSGHGVGVAVAMHVSGANAYPHAEESSAAVNLHADSSLTVRFAGSDAGTGQRTVLAQIAAAELGVPIERVRVEMMTSEGVPRDLGAWSSRGTFMGGHAVVAAVSELRARLRALAADKFGVDGDQVSVCDGLATSDGESVPIGDLVALAPEADHRGLTCEGTYRTSAVKMDRATGTGHFSETYSFVAQAVEVDVDTSTGLVRVVQLVTAHDSGVVVNPSAAVGQARGAAAMGLGAALTEELAIDGGRVINTRYLDYRLPRADDLPALEVRFVGGVDPAGPHGAKGLGEIGLVPTPAAVANAVAHAVGVRVRSLPLTPDKVLGELSRRQGSSHPSPRPLWRRPRRWWIEGVRRAYPRGLHTLLDRWGTLLARDRTVETSGVISPASVGEAVAALGARNAVPLAGGTDVIPSIRDGTLAVRTLVHLGGLDDLRGVRPEHSGGLRIGATTTLAELAAACADTSLDVIAHTVESIANPQIRATATVAGNLCQAKRCWFFRNGFNCYKRGGWTCPCYAVEGDHRFHHAVIDAHRCQAVTPSDLATTLAALGAWCVVSGAGARSRVDVLGLYRGPGETVLEPHELITEIVVPVGATRRTNRFEKLTLRSGDFAVASAAVSLAFDRDVITDARVVLGGVGPLPLRATRVERALQGASRGDAARIAAASRAWVVDAHPLPRNGWKLEAASALVERCVTS